jgi:hypothetical protein
MSVHQAPDAFGSLQSSPGLFSGNCFTSRFISRGQMGCSFNRNLGASKIGYGSTILEK